MPDVNELARTVQEAWDGQFTHAPDKALDYRMARTAVETVLTAARPRPVHDPAGDCTCGPNGGDRCEYRILADEILEAFNPPGDDVAEVAILISAVKRAAGVIERLPCECGHGPAGAMCRRCSALGQHHGVPPEAAAQLPADLQDQAAVPASKPVQILSANENSLNWTDDGT